jgi:MoaA/NifB/PqqE/SkfB family radical SAM enzyme
VEQIALSTNGSASMDFYEQLIDAGVNDFSISLDACCASTGDKIVQKEDSWSTVVENIGWIAERAYVTLGVVLFEKNLSEVEKIVHLGYVLGVDDIRLISAAQWNGPLIVDVPDYIRQGYPILNYRLNNLAQGRNVRGIQDGDANHCPLVLDDMAVEGTKHYPCIIYLREYGEAIGEIGPDVREQRKKWYGQHNTYSDPICKGNCLDVCIDYNNRVVETNTCIGMNMFNK